VIRWDYVLGLVGIALAIPSLIALWSSGSGALVLGGGISAIALLAAAWFVEANLDLPAISVESQATTVSFENDRSIAKLVRKYEFRVRRKGLDHWVHRNISAEGQISDFCWNGATIPMPDIVRRSNHIQVTVRSPYAWPMGKQLQGELSYRLQDSFNEAVEYLQYISDIPTKLAMLRVEFPPNQNCTSVYVQRRANGVVDTFEDGVQRDPRGRWLEVKLRKPKGGHEYTVYWHW
jgi:hypothetical protein